ncbi:hypothetical protein JET18_20775 [Chryseobacterium sp. L7]|uniref:DNA-directed DNA polymerase family A palm domain-containing protein n=1 Tax=Chryseobacterium endalhagicum TaxID=2797638 RepID=A0ABS1QN26_9FLAO|nr:hypothetical protein [Chryseobacterium endalhagicum]MBL1223288.1 hypothetical protein [Chryseobacterium endalhagicum]
MAQNQKVGFAFATNSKKNNSPSEKATLEIKTKGGYPVIDKLTFYLPQNLDIDKVLQDNPPQFNYGRDKLVYILNLIYALPARKKKSIENYNGFTPVSKTILGSTIKDYRDHINYLKEQGIVEEDNYIPDKKCGGLRFTHVYRQHLKPVEITSWTLIKNIVYLRKNYNSELTNDLIFLKKWFKDIDVDIKAGKKYLKRQWKEDFKSENSQNAILKYNSRLLPIEQLCTKENPLFFVDKTAGRLHTYITQLKSELRKFLKWKGKLLCSIDISNSQPFLLQSLLNHNVYEECKMKEKLERINPKLDTIMLGVLINSISKEEDVLLFKKIVSSGKFYEEFGKILKDNGEFEDISNDNLRKEVKNITFSTLFSNNKAISYSNYIRIFQAIFPNVYKVLKYVKKGQHNTLAIVLQSLEADLVLHKACKRIDMDKDHIPLFTLHDSIITTEENVEYVKSVLVHVMKENIGVKPNLKIERWE